MATRARLWDHRGGSKRLTPGHRPPTAMIRLLLKTAAALALIALLALASNPTPEQHREKISQSVSSRSELASLLRLGRVTAFFSEYYSVGVASYTKVGERTVSVGAFGYVHVIDQRVPAEAR